MLHCKRLAAVALFAALAALVVPVQGRTRKGDKLLAKGRAAEVRKQYDAALDYYEQAVSEDPQDPGYLQAVRRVRFQAAQHHVNLGQKLRGEGRLAEALAEFEKAYAVDPASAVAEQEARRTREMIEREKKKIAEPGAKPEEKPEEKGLTPAQQEERRESEKIERMLGLPELRPLSDQPISLKMNNQPPKVLFETVGKLAGINVIFDPDYQPPSGAKNYPVEFNNVTLEEALDYLAVMTKSFWKPLSANTIFVTQDSTQKRNDYEEQVMKVFYLKNVGTVQELQEVANAVRQMTDIRRLGTYNAQSAIVVRGEADKVALAEKIIRDLDKPKGEVIVDVVVMEVKRVKTRDLSTAIAPAGVNIPITYTPRASITTPTTPSSSQNNQNQAQNPNTPTTPTSTGTQSSTPIIPLSKLGKIATSDYSITLPGGEFKALMSDSNTRILQSPQVRVADNFKATLHVGDRVPTASGSFQPGFGGVGINPLVNTQFQYIDVGVKIDITPHIHGPDEVSLHVEAEVSSVTGHVNLGGIDQPIIGQRKVAHDVRMREGEVNILGGLRQVQDTKNITGVPGLASIPILRRLFTSESIEKDESELLIVLIPHIVRNQEITDVDLREIAVGNSNVVKLSYAPRKPKPGETERPQGFVVPPAAGAAAPPPRAAAPVPTPPAPVPVPPAGPPGAATAAFSPAQLEAQLGGALTVNLTLANATDLSSAQMTIKFDPKILRLNDINPGSLLSLDGQTVTVSNKNVLNDTGQATIKLDRPAGAAGVNGSGALVSLVFQAVGRGGTTVSAPGLSALNSKGQVVVTASPQATITVR